MKTRLGVVAMLVGLLPALAAHADDGITALGITEGGSGISVLSAGSRHSCVVQAKGGVQCWGDNTHGQVGGDNSPNFDNGHHAGPYLSVSTADTHTCALRTDGEIDCWGSVPGTLRGGPFLSVSASAANDPVCAVGVDGALACLSEFGYPQVLPGPYLSVSQSFTAACALSRTGTQMDCWGTFGASVQLPNYPGPYLSINMGEGIDNSHFVCAITFYGGVICGSNIFGWNSENAPQLAVSAGDYGGFPYRCVLRADGGALDCRGITDASFTGPFVSAAVGAYHACGLIADGRLTCWWIDPQLEENGASNRGQATVPATLAQPGAVGFGQIAAGNAHTCQIRPDGSLGCWGLNGDAQATPPDGSFVQVVAGDSHSCAIGTDGRARCWGRNGAANTSALGSFTDAFGTVWRQLAPGPDGAMCAVPVNSLDAVCVRGASVGWQASDASPVAPILRNITHARDSGGRPGLCGSGWSGEGGFPPAGYCSQGFDAAHDGMFLDDWLRLESGLNHQCGLHANGTLACWGDNSLGQTSNVPTGGFRALSVGWNHACAIRGNGELACWGSNVNGQVSPPTGTYVQVAAGNTFSCAIRSDGVRVCWGDDSHGQAPQLAVSPASIGGGNAGMAYAGETLSMVDTGHNAAGDYVPPTQVFRTDPATLPPGLSLSAAGVLGGTPTTAGSFSFTVDAEDANGFAASRSYTVVITDPTPPAISYMLDPAAPNGSNGWYTGDVLVDWAVTDPESAISGSTGCDDGTLASDSMAATFTCTATSAGGTSSMTTSSIKRDATPPELAPNVPSPLALNASASASPNASDATSGVATSGCDPIDTSTLGDKSLTCRATDKAGNANSVIVRYAVTTCANEGYTGTKLTWCQNICEKGYTGSTLDTWLRRWINRYHDLPYCQRAPAG